MDAVKSSPGVDDLLFQAVAVVLTSYDLPTVPFKCAMAYSTFFNVYLSHLHAGSALCAPSGNS